MLGFRQFNPGSIYYVDPATVTTDTYTSTESLRASGYRWRNWGPYLESLHDQRSPDWFAIRKHRCSSSLIYNLAGYGRQKLDDILAQLRGTVEVPVNELMIHGTVTEPVAATFYHNYYEGLGYKILTREMGVCIRPGYFDYCDSPDRLVYLTPPPLPIQSTSSNSSDMQTSIHTSQNLLHTQVDGCLEIKCPKVLYEGLQEFYFGNHPKADPTNSEYDPYYHNHIKNEHYAQMQHHMFTLSKQWCDYLVYVTDVPTAPPSAVYLGRVLFNPTFYSDLLTRTRPLLVDYLVPT